MYMYHHTEEYSKNKDYSIKGDIVEDVMQIGNSERSFRFLAIEQSSPQYMPKDDEVRMDVDGWIGLSNHQGKNRLMEQVLDPQNKKFAIYIADEGSNSTSSIQIGGFNDSGFSNQSNPVQMESDVNYRL